MRSGCARLGTAATACAEVGECFAAARLIKELDAQSWFDVWYSLAETVFAEANKSRAAGRPVSALDQNSLRRRILNTSVVT
jgi:hypothetical protein